VRADKRRWGALATADGFDTACAEQQSNHHGGGAMKTDDEKSSPKPRDIGRTHLLTAIIDGQKTVDRVEVMEIQFPAHQQAGLHLHPCPVVRCVTAGTILFQVEGRDAQVLKTGDAFFEPANTRIIHFDNPADAPATFVAYYLLSKDDHELVTMLPEAKR
jgi:quercetin dioxygenase-like cupin family protein